MTPKALISLVKTNWLFCLMLIIAAGLAYKLGFSNGQAEHQDKLTSANSTIEAQGKRMLQVETQMREAAERQSAALAGTVARQQQEQARADKLARNLLTAQEQLSHANKQLKKGISHALNNDGATTCGLGPDSLRLYRSGLGYPPDPGDRDTVPSTTGNAVAHSGTASGPGGGLPPGDLLAHAADYGQWCQQLEKQLIGLNKWNAERP
jgi:type II secretory pathway pseudopilin PulG